MTYSGHTARRGKAVLQPRSSSLQRRKPFTFQLLKHALQGATARHTPGAGQGLISSGLGKNWKVDTLSPLKEDTKASPKGPSFLFEHCCLPQAPWRQRQRKLAFPALTEPTAPGRQTHPTTWRRPQSPRSCGTSWPTLGQVGMDWGPNPS